MSPPDGSPNVCSWVRSHIEDSRSFSIAHDKGSQRQQDKKPKMASATPPQLEGTCIPRRPEQMLWRVEWGHLQFVNTWHYALTTTVLHPLCGTLCCHSHFFIGQNVWHQTNWINTNCEWLCADWNGPQSWPSADWQLISLMCPLIDFSGLCGVGKAQYGGL